MFIMKHATSRFLRFFLVAALVAAMAGSLMPSKALGIASTDVPSLSVSPGAAGEASEWVITFTTEGPIAPNDGDDATTENTDITLAFTGATIPEIPTDDGATLDVDEQEVARMALAAHITVESGGVSGSPTTLTAGTTTSITFETPVLIGTEADATATPAVAAAGGEATITISVDAGIRHATPAAATSVEVTPENETAGTAALSASNAVFNRATPASPTGLDTGQVARWDVTTNNVPAGIIRNQHEIMVSFTAGTVPSSIDKNSIRLISGAATGTDDVAAGSPALNPSISGKTIRFVSPVDVDDGGTLRVIIGESAGIAAPGQPGEMAIVVRAGESNARMTSVAVSVGAFLRISPSSGPRGTTVTVTGGGFTAGTSGKVQVDGDNAGDYTVDSAGKLTGSFVATSGTAGGGPVSVVDLGRGGDALMGPSWTQTPSASPASTNVTRGSSVKVTLNDFPGEGDYTATIGGAEGDFFDNETSSLVVPQTEGTGTKQVVISRGDGSARFLITIGSRTLTVSPSSAVPGQAITVSGAGFAPGTVALTLDGGLEDDRADSIRVNNDGTFLYTGRVPFTAETKDKGKKTWTATSSDGSRAATSSGFTIQARAVTLSPSTANPGATVEVYGSGWGVTTSEDGNKNSEVTIEVTGTNAIFGPFPISSSGEFTGAITVPSDSAVGSLDVTATDNNGDLAGDDYGNQSKTAKLTVATGVISVSPDTASTGSVITISGSGFPAQTNLSALTFGDGNALPVPAPATDVSGNFTVTLTVPAAARGGSLPPGAVVITARVGQISGTTSFTIPGPSITLSTSSAMPGGSVTVTGTNFSAFSNVATINVGQQNQAPTPNPLTDATGNFSASVIIPALNPGAYTITVRTTASFTATAPITILSSTVGNVVPAEQAFQALTSRGILTLAAAAPPGGTMFGAYVPGLAGNTLVNVEPNGVLILTLNADARIAVSGQPAVDVAAGTPTFFALGSRVSIEVVE